MKTGREGDRENTHEDTQSAADDSQHGRGRHVAGATRFLRHQAVYGSVGLWNLLTVQLSVGLGPLHVVGVGIPGWLALVRWHPSGLVRYLVGLVVRARECRIGWVLLGHASRPFRIAADMIVTTSPAPKKFLAAPDLGPEQPRKKSDWIRIAYCFHCFAAGVNIR